DEGEGKFSQNGTAAGGLLPQAAAEGRGKKRRQLLHVHRLPLFLGEAPRELKLDELMCDAARVQRAPQVQPLQSQVGGRAPLRRGEGAFPFPSFPFRGRAEGAERAGASPHEGDRKSTRLNSSHVKISYAVFCLKKKKNKTRKMNAEHR